MLFVKKLKNNTLLVDLEKLEIGKKRKPLNFIAWKWCVILLDINDVGWPSGRGDNYPEAYRIYWSFILGDDFERGWLINRKTRRILYENLARRGVPGRLAAGTVYSNKRRFVSYPSGWKSLSQRLIYQLGRSNILVPLTRGHWNSPRWVERYWGQGLFNPFIGGTSFAPVSMILLELRSKLGWTISR